MVKNIRPANLVIIGATQAIFWFLLIKPVFSQSGIDTILNNQLFFLLMIMTILVTAGGYLINDVMDLATDRVNKPKKVYLSQTIDIKKARSYYLVLNFLAISIASIIFYKTNSFNILAICGTCILLLWFYSRYLKSTILMGNVVVSLLIGLVPFILVIVEGAAFESLSLNNGDLYKSAYILIISFTVFAFLANLIREIIKDCEDLEGDRSAGILTIATALGFKKADLICQTLTCILFGLSLLWFFTHKSGQPLEEQITFPLFIALPIIFLFYLLTIQERDKVKYRNASIHNKFMMVLGLIYLFIHLQLNYA